MRALSPEEEEGGQAVLNVLSIKDIVLSMREQRRCVIGYIEGGGKGGGGILFV